MKKIAFKYIVLLTVPALVAVVCLTVKSYEKSQQDLSMEVKETSLQHEMAATPKTNEEARIGDLEIEAMISKEIQTAVESEDRPNASFFAKVTETFPEMKDEVIAYERDIIEENSRLDRYLEMVRQKNQALASGEPVHEELNEKMEAERQHLLHRSRELGEEAMKINARIRELAALKVPG